MIKNAQVVGYQQLILQAVLIFIFCHISNVYIVLIKLNKRSPEGGNPVQLTAHNLKNLEAPVGHHSSQDRKAHGAMHEKSAQVN